VINKLRTVQSHHHHHHHQHHQQQQQLIAIEREVEVGGLQTQIRQQQQSEQI